MAWLTAVEIACYALASALFLGYLVAPREGTARAARWALAVAVLAQLGDIGVRCVAGENPVSSTPDAVAFVAFLVAAGYFGASFRYRLHAAGAFAVPTTLTLLLLARVVPGEPGGVRMGSLGRIHIFLATLGVAVFTLAAVLALVYLVEERRLKRKRFDQLSREAPLATLDRLALRCVSFGFPIFTIALVTGAIWIARLGGSRRPRRAGRSTCWRGRRGSRSGACWSRASARAGAAGARRG